MNKQTQYFYQLIEECVETFNEAHHAIFEHSFKTDEQLMNRIRCESVDGASCFSKEMDIVEVVSDIIYESTELLKWMKEKDDGDLRLSEPVENCGKKYLSSKAHDWRKGAIPCNTVIVILGKKYDISGSVIGIYVKTAYPV